MVRISVETGQRLSILYVAYPLLTVSDASAGGAEQVLFALEREMATIGHRTAVAGSSGSRVTGRLIETGAPVAEPDRYEEREREHARRILEYLQRNPEEFDLIHDQSGSFFRHACESPVPVMATLHLPRSFYREDWLRSSPANLFFNCVSESQARTFADVPKMLGVVQNGIRIPEALPGAKKNGSVLWLGRICEEKAPHLAIEAAKLAKAPITLAGAVYPFSYHRQYFERELRPHLDHGAVRFVETPDNSEKNRLLGEATAVLLTSTVEETSSLVAMEAMAAGTPVIAFRRGAFPEIVAEGETGWLVDTVEQMAVTIQRTGAIRPEACRERVRQYFTAGRMGRDYLELYRKVLRDRAEPAREMGIAS